MMITVLDTNGNYVELDYDVVTNMMDDELREEIHNYLAPCTEQEFYDEYSKRHFEKFREEFVIN